MGSARKENGQRFFFVHAKIEIDPAPRERNRLGMGEVRAKNLNQAIVMPCDLRAQSRMAAARKAQPGKFQSDVVIQSQPEKSGRSGISAGNFSPSTNSRILLAALSQ